MALKVWLPLNGDLKNYGCSEATTNIYGATVNTAGKIGSCYSFDGSDDYISINCPALYSIFTGQTQPFSIAFWVYHNDSTRAIIFGDYSLSGTIQFNIELTISHGLRFYWAGSPDKKFSENVGLQQWTHIAITYNGSKINLYKNGIKSSDSYNSALAAKNKTSGDFYLGRDSRTGDTAFNGKLNDFRIYDHCLSAAEVKEISQGLVLHYKLDGFFGGVGENLVINGDIRSDLTYWSNWGTATDRQVTTINGKKWLTFKTDATGKYGGFSQVRELALYKPDTQYRVSALMFASANTPGRLWVHMRSTEGGANLSQSQNTVNVTTSPQKYYFTFNTGHDANYTINKINLMVGAVNATSALDFYISDIKIEEGTKTTAWIPCKEELNYDMTKITDSSGYNHHGIIANEVISSPDSSRYNQSINLKNGNSMINCGRGGMVTDSITVNMWIKTSSWANPVSCTESGGWNFEINNSSISFPIYITDIGYVQSRNGSGAETIASATVADNTWHMLTGVYDRIGQTVKLYLDGELKQQNTVSAPKLIKYHSSNSIWIGGEATASSATNGMAGLFSDFRIYCTPLLDNDIKLLYNIGMKVDNLGSLHTYELEETNADKLYKTGVLKSQGFYENGYIEILHYDKNIYTEPDGSTWIHICHHNNPANGVFSSNGSWATGYYIDANRWYDVEQILPNLINYEFMVKQKTTSSATEAKYRWIQSINPRNATWDDVKPGTVTYITTSGYTSSNLGGLYYRNDNNQRMCIANNTNGNWYGGIGVWSTYNGGIPGYPNTVVTSGYVDLYARVYISTKLIKDIGFNSMNFIEM